MKIFVNRENSGWIFDDIYADYVKFSRHNVVGLNENPEVGWFLNPWGFFNVAKTISFPSFVHVHHIDDSKLFKWKFDLINKYAKGCIVPNKKTEEALRKFIEVPIYKFPYWILSKMTVPKKDNVVDKEGKILIGSFQKDSEGNTEIPKLSKGPDIFLNILIKLNKLYPIKVILSGYNRGFIIKCLKQNSIGFSYFQRVKNLNELYDSIDWYFVTSRIEGGPQAVLEASYRKVRILSTDVGISPEVLHPDCICRNVGDFICKFAEGTDRRLENFEKIKKEYMPENIIGKMDVFFEEFIYENRSIIN